MALTKSPILESLLAEVARSQGISPAALGLAEKAGSATGTPSGPNVTGPGGIFGVDGLERDIFSTRVQPLGMVGMLPAVGTRVTNPLYPFITGFTASTGSNPVNVCDDPATAGAIKGCITTAQFGRYTYKTQEVDLSNIGRIMDRGEFQDLILGNDPLLAELGNAVITPNVPMNPTIFKEVLMRWVALGVTFQNTLMQQVWAGNPANNTAGGGYQEFPGLNNLIVTGHVDAETNASCPSLDSLIQDFNYGLVQSNAQQLVNTIAYAFRYVKHNANRMGMDPVTWVCAMREELFYEVSAIWPLAYMTYRGNGLMPDTQQREVVEARDVLQMRDSMRTEHYLMIDGIRLDVVFDDGIPEASNTTNSKVPNTQFASDIYILPLRVRGNFASLYLEYFDFAGQNAGMDGLGQGMAASGDWYWTDGGRFFWHRMTPVNWCMTWEAMIRPRIILRTPHLATRIKNVCYQPLVHTRQPFNTDPYFVNGGQSTARQAPSLYNEWGGHTVS